MPFKQTFVLGAFEEQDKDEILKCITKIEDLKGEILKKKGQGRATKYEERDLAAAPPSLLQKSLEAARQVQPSLQDPGKPRIGAESKKAIRSLFLWIDSTNTTGGNVDETQLRSRVEKVVEALKTDGVDYEAIKVEDTPALSFEQLGAPLALVDEDEVLALANAMDWDSADPSEYGKEAEDKLEKDEGEVIGFLDWPHKLDESEYSFRFTKANDEDSANNGFEAEAADIEEELVNNQLDDLYKVSDDERERKRRKGAENKD